MAKKLSNTYTTKEFEAKIVEENGHKEVKVLHPKYWHWALNKFKSGEEVTLSVTNKKPKRTSQQNKYYHLYLSLISESSGHSTEWLHVWVKGKFLSKGIKEIFGDKTRLVKSTAELTVLEFIELIERIAEKTQIPPPNPEPFKRSLTWDEYEKLKSLEKRYYQRLHANIETIQ